MTKYNWKQLEKEYILSDYNTVTSFIKAKGIPNNGSTKKKTSGWKSKKVLKEEQKSAKIVEKVLEKQSEQEAKKIVSVKDTAEMLLKKINESIAELDRYIAKTTTKTKRVKFDYKTNKPKEEVTTEESVINEYKAIIDRFGLKNLAAALKDINDILENPNNANQNSNGILTDLIGALKDVKKD